MTGEYFSRILVVIIIFAVVFGIKWIITGARHINNEYIKPVRQTNKNNREKYKKYLVDCDKKGKNPLTYKQWTFAYVDENPKIQKTVTYRRNNNKNAGHLKKFFVGLFFYSGLAVPLWWFIIVMISGLLTRDAHFAAFGGRVLSSLIFFAIPLQIAMEKNIKYLLIPLALVASIIHAISLDMASLRILIITFIVCLILSIVAKKR